VPDDSHETLDLPTLLRLSWDARAHGKTLCQRSVDLREKSRQLAAVSGELLRAEQGVWATA
jgi:hypothetical protein